MPLPSKIPRSSSFIGNLNASTDANSSICGESRGRPTKTSRTDSYQSLKVFYGTHQHPSRHDSPQRSDNGKTQIQTKRLSLVQIEQRGLMQPMPPPLPRSSTMGTFIPVSTAENKRSSVGASRNDSVNRRQLPQQNQRRSSSQNSRAPSTNPRATTGHTFVKPPKMSTSTTTLDSVCKAANPCSPHPAVAAAAAARSLANGAGTTHAHTRRLSQPYFSQGHEDEKTRRHHQRVYQQHFQQRSKQTQMVHVNHEHDEDNGEEHDDGSDEGKGAGRKRLNINTSEASTHDGNGNGNGSASLESLATAETTDDPPSLGPRNRAVSPSTAGLVSVSCF